MLLVTGDSGGLILNYSSLHCSTRAALLVVGICVFDACFQGNILFLLFEEIVKQNRALIENTPKTRRSELSYKNTALCLTFEAKL